ncbi:uncharacterized mitochondrial protein AtMg00820-like [Pyrus x bretschneideri]|uniref:uncharacterized mitochondrial protein AtMg00820-like n=1 Tax=Pyrus x bretschneideri TaxID=225117 RepID=UPI0020304B24|nr:uncharacterized mitochondrial protein AtMg00820-like [Pyrus x bretschneideri]
MSNTTFTQLVLLSHSTPTSVKGHKEPTSYSQAATYHNWQQAMTAKLNALQQNNTWTLVPLHAGYKPIGCKWVYRIKYQSDGTIDCYKARVVAKGYTQVEGVDYIEMFSPTTKLTILRCILSRWFSQLEYSSARCSKRLSPWRLARGGVHGPFSRTLPTE